MRFTFSEQKSREPSKNQTGNLDDSQGSGVAQEEAENKEVFERLKEDAPVYGWEFSEERQALRPAPVF